jgi:DNA-3-methyladenine glycosylase
VVQIPSRSDLSAVLLERIDARFSHEFFTRQTLAVCRSLIGAFLVHRSSEGLCAGRIVEAEAYLGPADKGAHSFGGRNTPRTAAMFGEKGRAYIFIIYGMYWCFNVVSGPIGKPQAILIRALEPVLGLDLMRTRLTGKQNSSSLCRGPGKLCKALAITREQYGEDLTGEKLFLVPGMRGRDEKIAKSPRINIDYADEYVHKEWRFFIKGNPAVSGSKAYR